MQRYILLYKGPTTPPDASHEGWPEWFAKIGDALVDKGSPMANGLALRSRGRKDTATSLNGYSIIQAGSISKALSLLKDHPYLSQGDEYTVEIFEVPGK